MFVHAFFLFLLFQGASDNCKKVNDLVAAVQGWVVILARGSTQLVTPHRHRLEGAGMPISSQAARPAKND